MTVEDLVSIREAAGLLGVGYWAAYGRSASGAFGAALRLGNALYFKRSAVESAARTYRPRRGGVGAAEA